MITNTAIEKWIKMSDPDYYTMFIKAWIPYNAWYMHNFCDEDAGRTTDRSIIEYIKNESNLFKNKISALLQGNGDESIEFKHLLSRLHYGLENHPIPDFENRISFSSICLHKNTKNQETINEKTFSIKGTADLTKPKKDLRVTMEIIDNKKMTTISLIRLHSCSLKELHENLDYIKIDGQYKSTIEKCLNEINPEKKESIVIQAVRKGSKYLQPTNSICINNEKNLYFTDNIDEISRAIIQILYELRCKLFHGEIEPSETNLGVYEQAFYIQRTLIKALR